MQGADRALGATSTPSRECRDRQSDSCKECLRFYDCHLKGIENGIMDKPKLRVYMPDSGPLRAGSQVLAGTLARHRRLAGGRGGEAHATHSAAAGRSARRERPPARRDPSASSRSDGVQAPAADPGTWGGLGGPVDNSSDQRPEDGQSLCFDTEVLTEPLEILGFPLARLEVSSDRPLALVVARLCDLWPDGESNLITRGTLEPHPPG